MNERREFQPLQAQERLQKDQLDLPLLESFRAEYEKAHAPQLRSAGDIVGDKPPDSR